MDETPAILIVDSNAGFATMLKESLEQDGEYRATVAHTGDEALQIASQESFALAIVDLGIDPIDDLKGELVARRLREGQADLRLMLIPLEGDELPEDLADLDVQGALPKPFFLPDLPDLLEAALTRPMEEPEEPVGTPRPSKDEPRPSVSVAPVEPSAEWPAEVVHELEDLAQEINADAVLLTRSGSLLHAVGRLPPEDLKALTRIVSQSFQLSDRAAQLLGREQQYFEQSVEGDKHTLYSLTVFQDVLLSAVLRPDVTLGLLRHEAKRTAKRLHDVIRSP